MPSSGKEWDGHDRRIADPWREAMEERMQNIETAVSCIKRRGDDFQATYGDLLKETLEAKATRAKLWALACEEIVKKGVWVGLIAIGAVVLVGLKSELKRWLFS